MMEHGGGWWILLLAAFVLFTRPWWWGPRCRARWWWGPPSPESRAARSEELDRAIRARLDLVDQLETRVAELENRLDFAERLLAGRRMEAGDRAG